MLRSRIIPCLLVDRGRLVKTVRFTDPTYVGDPLNAVRIFNEKQVDELMVLDISASTEKREPDYDLIEKLASVCRMPLCYGGGVKHVDQVKHIVSLGVEKVAVSSHAVGDPDLVSTSAVAVGRQSVVVVLDVRARAVPGEYEICIDRGRARTGLDAVTFARRCQELGAGEIVVNSIDRDGTMQGYDLDLVRSIHAAVTVPLTALGGVGSLEDIRKLLAEFYPIGASAGSLFVFKGRFRAVLINYPNPRDREALPTGAWARGAMT